MTVRTSAVRLIFVVVAVFLALALPRRAFAGTLQIRDEARVLAAGDADRLRSQLASAPFDARLVFTSDYADADELSRFVGSLIDEPNAIAVGVDPRHRHVQVHFGRSSGIARAEWPAIETAGNGDFHDGNWVGGVAAMFRTASQSVTGAPASPVRPTPTPSGVGLGSMLPWVLLVGGGIAAFALFARRRSGSGMVDGPSYPGYRGVPYGGAPYGAPPGGMGPVGGGIIGAGLGGLAGYELGKLEGEREERRDVRDDDRGFDDDRDRGFDAGGGGSSWDDSGDGGGGSGGDGGGGFGGDGGGSDF